MSANLQIAGTYVVDGSKLVSTDKKHYLLIQERKHQTPKKPPRFIVAKCPQCTFPDTNKPDQYISSVFNNNRIEYNGVWYQITFDNGKAVITRST